MRSLFLNHPQAGSRNRIALARVEVLESRCMLSLAGLEIDLLPPSDVVETVGRPMLGNGESLELLLPDILPPELGLVPPAEDGPWIPLPTLPPWQPEVEPPDLGVPSLPGTIPNDSKPDESAEDPGGTIDIGGFDNPSDGSTMNGPAERETRDVLEMLSTLQYPSSASPGTAQTPDADDPYRFDRALDAEVWNDERFYDMRRNGGAIELLPGETSEVADDARTLHDGSLLQNIPVLMDHSAGRFQMFEVLTSEEAAVNRSDQPAPTAEPAAQSSLLNETLPEAVGVANSPIPGTLWSRNPAGDLPGSKTPDTDIDGAAVGAIDGERGSASWPVSLSLVAIALTVKLLRQRRFHRWLQTRPVLRAAQRLVNRRAVKPCALPSA